MSASDYVIPLLNGGPSWGVMIPYGSKDPLLGMHGKGTIWGGPKYLLRRYLDPLGLSSNLCLWRFFGASHYIPKHQQRTWKWLFPNGISSSRGPFVMFFSGVLGSKKAKPSSQSLLVVLTPYTLSPILMVENGYVWKGNDPIGDTPILDDYGRKGTSTRLVV